SGSRSLCPFRPRCSVPYGVVIIIYHHGSRSCNRGCVYDVRGMSEAATVAKAPIHRGHRLITNVLWSWTGVGASLFQGIVITRLLIKSLDAEHYGTWNLVFAILEYFWFFDLGLNTAVTNFCARFLATKESGKINEVINTS